MDDDQQLLRQYAAEGSEEAFATLVKRHLGLVYFCALRRCGGDAPMAEDVAQTVFTDLAFKARKSPPKSLLSGWLYRAACYEADETVRSERRRRIRETASFQASLIMNSEPELEPDRLIPVLDEALKSLRQADRDAILLRFFEERSLAEVGTALGTNEDAAQKKVTRALEKLRLMLLKQGVTTTAVALASALSAHAAQVPPAGLASAVTAASLGAAAPKAAGSGFALFKILAAHKLHAGTAFVAALAVTVPVVIHYQPRLFPVLAANVPASSPDSTRPVPEPVALLQACARVGDHATIQCEITDNIRVETRTYFQRARPDGSVDRAQVQSGSPLRIRLKNRDGEWMIDEKEAVRYDFKHDNRGLISDVLALRHEHPDGMEFTFGSDETINEVVCRTVIVSLSKGLTRQLADELRAKLKAEGRLKKDPDLDTLQFIAQRRIFGIGSETNLLFKYNDYDGNSSLLTDLTADYQALGPVVPEDVFEIPQDLPVFIASTREQLNKHHASEASPKRKSAWANLAQILSRQNARPHPVNAAPGGGK